jgi:VRR-NUC domain/FAN1, HTH domain/Fanconi anemia-associated nuclease SAP domain
MSHPRPFYYLENFHTALVWLRERYGDLLNGDEQAFIERFEGLPREPAALLVRMIGRKGDLFRVAKLAYAQIGCAAEAAAALIDLGWVDCNPVVSAAELGRLLCKSELHCVFEVGGPLRSVRKSELLLSIGAASLEPRRLTQWWPEAPDVIYRLVVNPLCDRLRALFFGNFRQDWSEFVLTDLGIFKYEKVSRDGATRAFQTRDQIDTFYALLACRQQLEEDDDLGAVLAALPAPVTDNAWLEGRRRKVQFQIAQCYERRKDFVRALEVYRACEYAGSRLRVVRMLERLEQPGEAFRLAEQVRQAPADEVEIQQIGRLWPRLRRKVGLSSHQGRPARGWPTFQLVLPVSERPAQLESATGAALSRPDAPVHFVENGLINSLFGLLCWEAIFAPVPGAFWHEFQAAPADLHAPEFRSRRAAQFAHCLGQLGSEAYQETIWGNFRHKRGIQSPFVFWGMMSEALLSLALDCLPAEHLQACFERILADVRVNRAGLPDLVQFWPEERRYRLVEVKGPGDRLQDNQIRWLSFCVAHAIPVSVCQVSW